MPDALAMVTRNSYAPAIVNVAVVFFAALVPLAANVTGAGGVPISDHVYVRFAWPPLSAPSTDSAVVVPLTGAGAAPAGAATVGALPSEISCSGVPEPVWF